MKTRSIFLIVFLTCQALCAQTTTGIAVQGIARDANKTALVAQTLSFKFTISGTPSIGDAVKYEETKNITTDNFGVFSHMLGSGDPSGFAKIPFGRVQMNLKVEAGGVLLLEGPLQYAPYAKNADNGIPVGGVIMWTGEINKIPPGWALCDGSTVDGFETPDLRGRFIVGVGQAPSGTTNYALKATGGQETVILTEDQMPGHNHGGTLTTTENGSHRHEYWSGIGNGSLAAGGASQIGWGAFTGTYVDGGWKSRGTDNINDAGNHTHTVTISAAGGNQAHENRPPYFALAYIVRIW